MVEKQGPHLVLKLAVAESVKELRAERGAPGMPDVADEFSGGVGSYEPLIYQVSTFETMDLFNKT